MKYYEVFDDDGDGATVVIANSPGKAKEKALKGDTISPFSGVEDWPYTGYTFTSLRVRRLPKLDKVNPKDDFKICKILINQYWWDFYNGNHIVTLNAENYSDQRLKDFLAGKLEQES